MANIAQMGELRQVKFECTCSGCMGNMAEIKYSKDGDCAWLVCISCGSVTAIPIETIKQMILQLVGMGVLKLNLRID